MVTRSTPAPPPTWLPLRSLSRFWKVCCDRTMKSYDIIVIGGGIAGAALSYALAQAGANTLLIDHAQIAGGASGATMGMALWVNARSERDIGWAAQGFQRLATLEQEL